MENTAAKIRVSLREGLLEIEGSEDFVSKQIENLKDLITKLPDAPLPPAKPATPANGQTPPPSTATLSEDAAKYVNIIAVEGDVVKILKDLPGSDKAKKTVSAALLYLLGKNFSGTEEAPFKELRKVCKDHGCLDESNFAGIIKDQKEWLIVLGSGKSQTAKLTVPGKKAAIALADSLNVAA